MIVEVLYFTIYKARCVCKRCPAGATGKGLFCNYFTGERIERARERGTKTIASSPPPPLVYISLSAQNIFYDFALQ